MAPHSSTLGWKISWTEEPGRPQSMGSLRVGHDWETPLSLFAFMHWRGNGNPLHVSCLENPRDGGAWWAAIYGVTQSQTWLKWLSSSRVLIKETNRKGKNLLFILFSNDFMELQTFTKALKSTLRTVSYNVNNAAFCSLVFLTLLSDLREDLFSFFLLGFAPEI